MLYKNKKENFAAIILAAGKGERFGKKKQNLKLDGKPLWKFVKDRIKDEFGEVIVVGVDVKGGKRRRDSVLCGIRATKLPFVVIFDSARPLVSISQVKAIKKVVLNWGSVSFAYDPPDTWYMDGKWQRDGWYALQVPQAFNRDLLLIAHENYNGDATDDCSMVYQFWDKKPHLLKGGTNLHKITYPDDYYIIKTLWRKYKKKKGF